MASTSLARTETPLRGTLRFQHSSCRRQEQIEFLRAANPYVSPAREDPVGSWDLGLRLQTGDIIRLRVYVSSN